MFTLIAIVIPKQTKRINIKTQEIFKKIYSNKRNFSYLCIFKMITCFII